MDFNDSTLFISARSPFARRVRLAFAEHGLRHEERVLDVFKPTSELLEVNPLARVPALRLKTGEVVIDSEKILDLLYRLRPESPWNPEGLPAAADRLTARHWSGLATGLCDRTVEYFLETLRPEAARDVEVLSEFGGIVDRVLARFEAFIGARASIVEGRLTQADLDLGTALGYLTLRYPRPWKDRYPAAAAYFARLEERASFAQTRPPA